MATGEQQPESDHHFKGEKTESGVFRDRHWRSTSGWLSYDLKNKNRAARKLVVTYYGRDKDRKFDIYINDKLLKAEALHGSEGDKFIDISYELPEEISKSFSNETINLKFVAHAGSIAGPIYYIRLLK